MADKGLGLEVSPEQLEEEGKRLIAHCLDLPIVETALHRTGIREEDVVGHVLGRIRDSKSLTNAVGSVWLARREAEEVTRIGLLADFLAMWARRPVRVSLQLMVVLSILGALAGWVSPLSWAVGSGAGILIAFLINFSLTLQLPRLRSRSEGARRARRRAWDRVKEVEEQAIENAILPEIRQRINELDDPPFCRTLSPLDTSGLKKLFDPEYEVPVEATERFRTTLESLESGSVGVAGPRGVGKTTLIGAACDGRIGEEDGFRGRGMLVSAPVRYAGQDFIRFIFARLCMDTIEPSERERRLVARREANRLSYRNWLVGVTGVLLISVIVLGVISIVRDAAMFDLILPFGGLAGFFGLMALGIHRWPWLSGAWFEDPLKDLAKEYLERLRFIETFSEERSSELAAKGAKLTSKRGVSRASLAWTLPEVIHHYRDLAARRAERRPLLIGIDELDKMASSEDARSFLNEMKSLFDQPGVFYLVSISEDALSDFERRGQPIRDVFDSVFSEVLHLRYLNLEESSRLLKRRAISIPPPWPALFHSLAGGLPRESLRVARSATRLTTVHGDQLDEVALGLVADRVHAHEHATSVMARQDVGPDGSQPILRWLRSLPAIEPAAGFEAAAAALRRRLQVTALIDEVKSFSSSDRAEAQLERLVVELAAGCYHALTCLEFFVPLDVDDYESAAVDVGGISSLGLLARAHQDLAVAPELAWETLNEFRTREELATVGYLA